MKKFLFLFLFAAMAYACNKDNYGPKPILTFEGYSIPSIDSNTAQLQVFFRVKDGDGDIDSSIYWTKHFYITPNPVPGEVRSKMPEIGENFGKSVNAQVSLVLNGSMDFGGWVEHTNPRPDSIWFTAYVIDAAGNSSDTITTKRIPIFKVN
ncbi:hypothetical protein [Chitinophaga sp. Cy-1792]|uniref:hypothetical protein n=1 Tax=Chitinophaga sp. Cy-1792 TaxID=2608339 RepID=UPI00142292F4|nr:hypothetical protein [Chitinophaga sp. Cy-1792]NIG53788.1 hypothetical protein [Chitinophaga sp. Cy-1792]